MDTAWIQVFVLVLSECVAPEGKTVCQQHDLELQFVDRADCETALEQLVALKAEAKNVIVEPDSARCVVTARRQAVYPDLAEISAAHGDADDWQPPSRNDEQPDDTSTVVHRDRLKNLPACEDTGGVGPCTMGNIIIEAPAPKEIKVWQRER